MRTQLDNRFKDRAVSEVEVIQAKARLVSAKAGVIAAKRFGAAECVDPRPFLQGSLKETFETYPGIGQLLPAMGYGDEQVADLEKTINAVDCDLVIVATPIDLTRILKIDKPFVRVGYRLEEQGDEFVKAVTEAASA